MKYDEAIANVLSLFDSERARVDGPRQKAIYDLRRMEKFLYRIGNPHRVVPTVHIAGTKGKGSTAALCDSAFHAAGLSTGFYSSPHLHTFRERIRRDCEPVSEEEFAELVEDVWALRSDDKNDVVTLFEFLTGMAFHCYVKANSDVQTIEVGLGGRLDATNVVDAQICVITSVSLDHAKILGNTIGEIAADKAGIIKTGSTPVIAPQKPEALSSILEACNRLDAQPILIGQDVTWQSQGSYLGGQRFTVCGLQGKYELDIPLAGDFQLENAATAVAAIEAICRVQGFLISPEQISEGFRKVSWPCRMELLGREPLVVADGAHNDYSVDRLLESLPRYFDFDKLVVIAGFSRDKNLEAMVDSLAPAVDIAIATQSRHPRALESAELAGMLTKRGAATIVALTPREALEQAKKAAGKKGLVLATGSLFLAAEVREAVLGIEPEVYPTLSRNKPTS